MAKAKSLRILPAAPGWEVRSGAERGIVYKDLREALVAAAECFEATILDLHVARDGHVSLRRGVDGREGPIR